MKQMHRVGINRAIGRVGSVMSEGEPLGHSPQTHSGRRGVELGPQMDRNKEEAVAGRLS